MKKVIIIGAIPNERAGERALDAAVAGVLARALTLITNKPSSVEDNLSAAQVLIEILGEDNIKETYRKEIESIERELTSRGEELRAIEKLALIEPIIDETPWYNRFMKPKKDKFNKFNNQWNNKKIYKKGTRKKWIPSLFFL